MQLEDVKILMRVETQAWLTAHREHDPVQLALSNKSNVNLPPVVYSQLKIVQKAAVKLPSWVAANCIIPGRAYEQSSSERAAALKPWSGKRCLDLTSGLGVDAMHFARHFDEVIALEPDPVLAEVVRFNLQQFQVSNVKLEQSTAEAWLEQYEGQSFDLIYVDPDRRDEHGNRQQSPAKGKPDIRALIPKLMQIGKRLVIKASPLYDIAEAKRDFPEASQFTMVSVDGEVKELLIEINLLQSNIDTPVVGVWCDKNSVANRFVFENSLAPKGHQLQAPEVGQFVCEPDAAFYASRTASDLMATYFPKVEAKMNSDAGFYFSSNYTKSFPGRVFAIREILAYKPKLLRRRFQKTPMLITRRHFPFSVNQIRKATSIPDGGSLFLICSMIGKEKIVFLAERVQ